MALKLSAEHHSADLEFMMLVTYSRQNGRERIKLFLSGFFTATTTETILYTLPTVKTTV